MFALVFALVSGVQTPPADTWTWTLYDDSPVVLANEVPDTASLRATLECEPGDSVARLTLYDDGIAPGMARISAGDVTAMSPAEAGRSGAIKLAMRTDHPTFATFAAGGALSISIGETRRTVDVPAAHLAKLRRFAELCAG